MNETKVEFDFRVPLTVWGVSEYMAKAIQMGDIGLAYDLLLSELEIYNPRKKGRKKLLQIKRLAKWELRSALMRQGRRCVEWK